MRALLGRRQRGQTFSLAAMVVVAMVGSISMVVDAGIFFVLQRQFQAAADAGALAGAWSFPVCQNPQPPLNPVGCHDPLTDPNAPDVAKDVALANAQALEPLCVGPIPPPTVAVGTRLNLPQRVNTIVVTVECDAGYSFGRILGLKTVHISASGAAAIGLRTTTGEMGDFPVNDTACIVTVPARPCLIARLIE